MPKIICKEKLPTPFDPLLQELKNHDNIISAIFDRFDNEVEQKEPIVDRVFMAMFLAIYERQTKANIKTVESMIKAYNESKVLDKTRKECQTK